MRQTIQYVSLVASVAVALIGVSSAAVQQAPPAPAQTPPTETSKDAPPSLDELLGIKTDQQTEPAEPGEDIIKKLTGEEGGAGGADVATLFLEAADRMGKSAVLLLDQRSAGLATQRFQEEALLKLDTLIAQAQKQSQQKSQPQAGQPSPQPGPPQPQQQQQQANAPGSDASRGGDNRPDMKQTNLNGAIDETRSEWGNLPPRVRELLRQGRGDSAARLYQRLTEIYYQRLAEESQP